MRRACYTVIQDVLDDVSSAAGRSAGSAGCLSGDVETMVNPIAVRRRKRMKHVRTISRKPAKAADTTIGQVIVVVAAILEIIGNALTTKN